MSHSFAHCQKTIRWLEWLLRKFSIPSCACVVFLSSARRVRRPTITIARRANVDPDAFLQAHFTIDATCTRTEAGITDGAKKRGMIERSVKDAVTIVQGAQSIQRTDPAYAGCVLRRSALPFSD
jgi:hypothetical protein